MLDDEINKRICEAADRYHPAYADEAWQRMERLLDEQLPQKKDRRRIFFFLLFAAMVCAGLFFIFYPHEEKSPSAFLSNATSGNSLKADHKKTESPASNPLNNSDNSNTNDASISPVSKNVIAQQQKLITAGVDAINTNQESSAKNKSSNRKIRINKDETSNANVENATTETTPLTYDNKSSATPEMSNNYVSLEPATSDVVNKISATNDQDSSKNNQVVKAENQKESKGANRQTKIDKSFKNNFGINISTGADVSGVTVSEAGKISVSYGAGLSYDLSNRFTLRTGFYIGNKIYSASKNEYHSSTWTANYNYLYNINANCKVYEIPLTVSYHFAKANHHEWFASGGLSSYLMKREEYKYYYKYPSWDTTVARPAISDQNQHYFSVLDLSGGYKYRFSKSVSLLVEPYLKIPLSGVGAGKVKLNSAGVLFTVAVKPFRK